MEQIYKSEDQNRLATLEQIISLVNNANDPVQFTKQVAEILYSSNLITDSEFKILVGQL